ncbi:hypothetical protein E2I00_005264, partial [Balaenoptera physalus]
PEELVAAICVISFSEYNSQNKKNNIQRYFGTNSMIYSKKDKIWLQSMRFQGERQPRQFESTVNVQTTKPPNRRQLKSVEATTSRLQKAPEDAPKRETLPFDKQTTKSELLQQHKEDSRAQKEGERPKISFSNIISATKVARSACPS